MGSGEILPGVQRQGWGMRFGCYIIANHILVGHGGPTFVERRLRVGPRTVEDQRQRLLGSRIGAIPLHDKQVG